MEFIAIGVTQLMLRSVPQFQSRIEIRQTDGF